MRSQPNPNKVLLGGIFGLVGGVFFLWVTIDGLLRNEAMTFSRHLAWFHQQDRPADFVASVLLHGSLSVAAIAASIGAIGRYFYFFYPPSRLLLSVFLGFLCAAGILFFANFSLFVIIGFPFLMLFGLPIAALLSPVWPPVLTGGFLPAFGSKQLPVALAYVFGFLAWWLVSSLLINRRLRRLESE